MPPWLKIHPFFRGDMLTFPLVILSPSVSPSGLLPTLQRFVYPLSPTLHGRLCARDHKRQCKPLLNELII